MLIHLLASKILKEFTCTTFAFPFNGNNGGEREIGIRPGNRQSWEGVIGEGTDGCDVLTIVGDDEGFTLLNGLEDSTAFVTKGTVTDAFDDHDANVARCSTLYKDVISVELRRLELLTSALQRQRSTN